MTLKTIEKLYVRMKNHDFDGWNKFQCNTSMLNVAGDFSALHCDFSMGDFQKWKLHMGDPFEVLIENQTVCKGYVDSIPVGYGPGVSNIQFMGRDATADLVDCMFDQSISEFKNLSKQKIITKLCSAVSVDVVIDSSAQTAMNKVIPTFRADIGRYLIDIISDICVEAGVVPVSLGDGKLTITKVTNPELSHDPISFQYNAVFANLFQDDIDRYSDYKVYGYNVGADNRTLEQICSPYSSFSDAAVSRSKSMVILNDLPTDSIGCTSRARFEARLRAALSRSVVYTLPGWMQSNGDIWKINKLVQVDDTLLGLSDTLLIIAVSYFLGQNGDDPSEGAFCKVHCADKDIFSGSAADINIKTGFDA